MNTEVFVFCQIKLKLVMNDYIFVSKFFQRGTSCLPVQLFSTDAAWNGHRLVKL